MTLVLNPYNVTLYLIATLLMWVAFLVWQKSVKGRVWLALALVAAGWWSYFYGLELSLTDPILMRLCFDLKHGGVFFTTPMWVLFISDYIQWRSVQAGRYLSIVLTLGALFSWLAVATSDYHDFFFYNHQIVTSAGISLIQAARGPLFWGNVICAYGSLTVAALGFLRWVRQRRQDERPMIIVLLVCVLIPWGANIISLLGWVPIPALNLSPFGFALSALIVAWLVSDMRLLDFIPITTHTIFESVADGMLVVDRQHRIRLMNRAAERILQQEPSRYKGCALAEIIPNLPTPGVRANRPFEFVWQERHYELRRVEIKTPSIEQSDYLLILHEITVRKRTEQQRDQLIRTLKESLVQRRALYRAARAVNEIEDLATQLQTLTEQAAHAVQAHYVLLVMLDRQPETIGALFQAGQVASVPPITYDALLAQPAVRQAMLTRRLVLDKPPSANDLEIGVAPILYRGELLGVLLAHRAGDADGFRRREGRLLVALASHAAFAIINARLFDDVRYLAMTDELTGLANRRHFLQQSEQSISHAQRLGQPLTALMVDIDHFKQVNDTLGHAAGDDVLHNIAQTLQQEIRSSDLLARYGGEEFAVLLHNTTLPDAAQIAERLRHRVAQTPIATAQGARQVTVSIGIAELEADTLSAMALLEDADMALYRAKNGGRNRVALLAHQAAE